MAEKPKKTETKRAKKQPYTGARKTAANKKRFLAAISDKNIFGNISRACEKIGISRSSFNRWVKSDPEFSEQYTEIKERDIDSVESIIYSTIFDAQRDSDRIRAAEIYLKARGKDRGYGVEKREQEHSGELEVNTPSIVIRLPDNGRRTYTDDKKA